MKNSFENSNRIGFDYTNRDKDVVNDEKIVGDGEIDRSNTGRVIVSGFGEFLENTAVKNQTAEVKQISKEDLMKELEKLQKRLQTLEQESDENTRINPVEEQRLIQRINEIKMQLKN